MTNKPTKPRAIIYRQLCTKGSAPKGQLAELKACAVAQGWDVVQVITDRYDPDTKAPKERTGLVEMLWLARMKKFDVLLAWSLDDLSRVGVKHTLNHLLTLGNNSVEWCFLKDPLFDSQGKQSEVVLAVLARLTDSATVRDKHRIAKEYEAGGKLGKKGRVAAGKLYAPTIEKAKRAQELRDSGMKLRQIAEELGVTYPRVYQLCQLNIEEANGRGHCAAILKKAKRAQDLRDSGMKLREIAEVLEVTVPRVHQLLQCESVNGTGTSERGRACR